MAFHVEVRQSHHRAWAFNLDAETLRRTVVEPWLRGTPLRIGDRDWDPREATLRVLDGPVLAPADLAHGQGWNSARRAGRDVARELLAAAAAGAARATIIAATPADRDAAAALLEQLAVTVIDWLEVRARLLAGEHARLPAQVALVVVGKGQGEGDWELEAGIALGALGPRAVLVAVDGAAGTQLGGLPVLHLGAGPAALDALAERLRRTGCQVRPRPATAT